MCIREQDTQHKTQQERTQPSNSNTYVHQEMTYMSKNISNNRKQQLPRQKFEHLMMIKLVETCSDVLLNF
jgi:uncharacterized protein YcbK (DUF882 family)